MVRRGMGFLIVACCLAGGCKSAVDRGVGSACASSSDCTEEGQQCLTLFKGGMCGIADCTASSQCPKGSVCVADPDFARNFCLLVCVVKPDCNINRPIESE